MSLLKRFKPAYTLYNLLHKKELLHNKAKYEAFGIKKRYYSPISYSDVKHLSNTPNVLDVKDSRTVLPTQDLFKSLDEVTQKALLSWSDNGFAIIPNFIDEQTVEDINIEVEKVAKKSGVKWQHGERIMFGIHHSKLLKSIGDDETLKNILQLLLQKEVSLFQSINFFNASQQRTHSDSIHMSTFPQGNIIAVWLALEDIDEENGPLHYYPGSHKLPYVMNEDYGNKSSRIFLGSKTYGDYEDHIQKVVETNNLEKKTFKANKGDILIWHANLLHGGEKLIDKKRSRKSMVFHYYTKDAICYHEITERPTLMKTGLV